MEMGLERTRRLPSLLCGVLRLSLVFCGSGCKPVTHGGPPERGGAQPPERIM